MSQHNLVEQETMVNVHDAPTWNAELPTPKTPDPDGYYCYLVEGAPSNAAPTHPGWGETPTEAVQDATYWANQMPWVTVTSWAETDVETVGWIDDCCAARDRREGEASCGPEPVKENPDG